jgi:GT2 family glycosyltransferase
MITTDIVIISFDDKDKLKHCIASIQKHCIDYNLIIEDNNPPNPNRFFTKAVNDGIQRGRAPFIWLLNSDAVVLEGAQQALINRFSYHSRVGIAGSMQLDYEDPDRIRGGGVFSHPHLGGRHRPGRVSMGHWRFPEKQTWQNFASVLLRRSMVESVGLLDESMFLVCSDSAYCYTCRQAGWECWYEPRSRVLHGLKASKTGTEWHTKDMLTFMDKWGITYEITPEKQVKITGVSNEYARLDMFP